MNQKKSTPDERFLLKLYELASHKGDPMLRIASKTVAQAIGMKEWALKNTLKLLAQANFIKKVDEESICLTNQGLSFVKQFEDDIS
jgi:Mn-dependent DtxR family transcriptional regulator